jgi:hypothetical protein
MWLNLGGNLQVVIEYTPCFKNFTIQTNQAL